MRACTQRAYLMNNARARPPKANAELGARTRQEIVNLRSKPPSKRARAYGRHVAPRRHTSEFCDFARGRSSALPSLQLIRWSQCIVDGTAVSGRPLIARVCAHARTAQHRPAHTPAHELQHGHLGGRVLHGNAVRTKVQITGTCCGQMATRARHRKRQLRAPQHTTNNVLLGGIV